MSAPMWAAASPSRPGGAAAGGAPPGAPPPPPPPPPSGFGGITVAGPAGAHARTGSSGGGSFAGGAPPPPPPVAAAAAPAVAAEPAPAPKPAFKPPPPIASVVPQQQPVAQPQSNASQRSMSTALPSPTQSYATAPAPLSTVRENSSSVSAAPSTPSHTRAPSASVAVDKTGISPALTQSKKDLNEVLEAGRASYNNNRELQSKKEKLDPEGRLTSMINRLWYRFAFLINAKYLGSGSDLAKEAILLLTVLCEVRQTVVDVFEYSKAMGDKVSIILTRHAWLFETAKRMEELVERTSIKLTSIEGKNQLNLKATTYVPQLLDAPLALFEDRLANFTNTQQQELFAECGNLKSLRSQVESYLTMNYEVALISLFITEAVGKAVGVLLPQKERRKLYFSSLLSTYSVCRANSWMLLKANHTIDLSKTLSKLNVQQQVIPASGKAPAAAAPGMPSVNAADLLRQNTTSASSVRALPTEEVLKVMMDGIILTGYFAVPNIEEPIVQRMAVWYDLIEGSANKIAANLTGKKGALYWAPERAARTKSSDCALPISDITDILLGKQTKVFQTVVGSKANPGCCVTLVAKGGYSMNFEAASKEALTQWMSGLTKLANASGKKMYEAKEQADAEEAAAEAAAAAAAAAGQSSQQQAALKSTASSAAAAPPLLSSTSSYTAPVAAAPAPTPASSFPPVADEAEEIVAPAVAPVPAVSYEAPALLSTTNTSYQSSAAAGLVNGGWVRCAAPDGNFYFYHAGRGESVWVQPPEYVGEPQSGPARVALEY